MPMPWPDLARWAPQSLRAWLLISFGAGMAALLGVAGLVGWPASIGTRGLLLVAAAGLGVFAAFGWGVGRLTRPLAELAAAIDRQGVDLRDAPLAERGPQEVQAMARAFNRMRTRIADLLADQTRMLAAISHDLRTPATRLRLRVEFVRDQELQHLMLRDLDEMDAMLTEALDFLAHDVREEPRKLVDVTALLQAVCDDYADVGRPVGFVEPPPLRFRSVPTLFAAAGQEHRFEHERRVRMLCRPNALRRAVNNLIDNALKYGFRAEVHLEADAHRVRIGVLDHGPGIADAELDKVLMPFYRIESSRQRSSGGMGLGLAIVKAVADAHEGRVELANRERGGLAATLELPREV
jgi:signal transduction histidine kinase